LPGLYIKKSILLGMLFLFVRGFMTAFLSSAV
jgi:hypothetical protein